MGLIGDLSRNPDIETDPLASHLTDPGGNMRFREQELDTEIKAKFRRDDQLGLRVLTQLEKYKMCRLDHGKMRQDAPCQPYRLGRN